MALPAVLALAALPIMSPSPAYAHERRDVGKYQFVVGFLNEPAFQDEPNGIDLAVTDRDTQQPVEGVDKTLKAAIAFGGGQPRELRLRARFGMPGKYAADLIPTRSGTYVFIFTGEINGQTINERFESGPGRFNDVEAATALHFPVAELTAAEMGSRLEAARQAAAEARTFGMIGTGVGALGLLAGLGGLLMGRRRPGSDARLSPAAQEGRG
jgi:hypothetical protein